MLTEEEECKIIEEVKEEQKKRKGWSEDEWFWKHEIDDYTEKFEKILLAKGPNCEQTGFSKGYLYGKRFAYKILLMHLGQPFVTSGSGLLDKYRIEMTIVERQILEIEKAESYFCKESKMEPGDY